MTVSSLTRRHFLATTAGAVGALALPSLAATANTPATHLTVDLTTDAESMDPYLVYQNDGLSVMKSLYDTLIDRDARGALVPMLAESYRWRSATLLEMTLRRGITFHNGEPLDAAAVAYSVQRMLNPQTRSQVRQSYTAIQRVETVGAATVRFHLSQPNVALIDALTQFLSIVPPRYIGQKGATYFATHPVGTGPYQFGEWVRDSHIALHAHPSYWAGSPKGSALAQTLTFRPISQAFTRIADLKTGVADLVRQIPPTLTPSLKAMGSHAPVHLQDAMTTRFAMVFLNTVNAGPLRDVRVRQALNYAVDVPSIITALMGGSGTRLAAPATPHTLGYDPHLQPYSYDPARARALLTQAGYPQGFRIAMDYPSSERADIVQAIAGQLSAVGVQVTLQPRELAVFNQEWGSGQQAPLRYATWGPMFEPWTLLFFATSHGILSKYANATVDRLMFTALATTDDTRRAALYSQVFRQLHNDAMGIFLFPLSDIYGVRNGLTWTPRADDVLLLTTAR